MKRKILFVVLILAAVIFPILAYRISERKGQVHIEKGSFITYDFTSVQLSGMFAVFSGILGALDYYDQGQFRGMRVNLDGGPYLDAAHGPNWWNYFFTPIELGDTAGKTYTIEVEDHLKLAHRGFHMPRQRAGELIQKYVHVSPEIQNEIDAFVHTHFDDHFVIGIHHRGTDKLTEMPIISYDQTTNILKDVISTLTPEQQKNFRIYIATDDQHFVTLLTELYPDQVVYSDFVRSFDETPLHIGSDEKYGSVYQKGKEALVDCLLLARSDFLIRPWSSLSIISDHFNPGMPMLTLKQRDWFFEVGSK